MTTTVLAGAQFVMYRVTENNVTQYYDNGTWVELKDSKTEADYAMTTPDNGELLFANLNQNGAYYLKEIAAPDGYNKLTQEIVFTVADGKVTVASRESDEYQQTGTDHEDQQLNLLVKNLSGFALPETGGVGTFPYVIGGTLLMAGCLLYGYLLRRKSERRSAR